MCGIAGLVLPVPREVDRAWVDHVREGLRHRGPDDEGCLVHAGGNLFEWDDRVERQTCSAVLVHKRLSILDVSSAGHQPMVTDDGRYAIVFNGEIYNYIELRSQLEAEGHRFRTRTDTEVLLSAYAAWGAAALGRFIGMFAFAILDTKEERIFLARDQFGIKPLYHARWRDGWAFCSEIEPLLRLPGVSRRVDPQALYDYLRHGTTDHGDATMFADVAQLPAAHYREVPLGAASLPAPLPYWRIDLEDRLSLSFDDAAERLRDLFVESVRLHLRSDVPLGFALSGGVDSSSIVMAARAAEPDQELHAFSYIAEGSRLNEEKWIDLVGGAARLVPHKVRPVPTDLVADLDSLIRVQEQPFGSTSMYAQYRVFRLAHEAGIKVMLDGQGADEMLAGYDMYMAARLASLVRGGEVAKAHTFWRRASNGKGIGRGPMLLRAGALMLPDRLHGLAGRAVGQREFPAWMNQDWFRARSVRPTSPWRHRGKDVLHGMLLDTLTRQSLPRLLRYEDRNSMAFSIESRVPFLTPRMAELVFALPEEYILGPEGEGKAVFRRAMRGLVPDAVLDRRDKIGFGTPEREWLSDLKPWVDGVLSERGAERVGPLARSQVRQTWDQIHAGGDRFDMRVWRWVNLIRWTEVFEVAFD